jgi:hypothetical protein
MWERQLSAMTRGLTLASLLIVGISCGERSNQEPIKTTVCAVAADPALFDGRVVTVPAIFESDGFEYSSLADPACGSIISVISGPTDDNAHQVLTKAVSRGRRGTSDKNIRGTFTGTFRWSPKEAPARTIELHTAAEVTVTLKSAPVAGQ